ncbi:NAD(P)/FAD-dependent oxidoreductase [Clostridium pasteurianum]|uniref:FAD-dependent dehydrogenase n=1 Tax=Clostridium pasteurianum BC1 TaxID=86416 RepID=R4KHR8_CLOPA|nr:FAD-dependent oxidoreductase [Clostridium pasteurianum]AGK99160.1 FAD-dependent dehydrogenase [Clostridium pasteurianum BC1]
MSIRINNLTLNIEEDISSLKKKAASKLKVSEVDLKHFKILKESIDARKKNNIKFNYAVEASLEKERKIINRLRDKDIRFEEENNEEELVYGSLNLNSRPVIIGMGPAGMFAGLLLAEKGYRPIVIERGESVENRTNRVEYFWRTGKLNTESNVQFGEGGAGTFSDGKLTTRIKDKRCDYVIDKFISFGAPEEISYEGKPHIGTDILKNVVKNLREKIKALGGEVRFNSRLEDIITKNNKIKAVVVNGEEINCETLILAIGHSSRDTYEMIYKKDILMEPKPFALGVRIEHPQDMINENQYGKYANHSRLKAADYRLTYTSNIAKRSIYSFCMCPGGEVVAAASEKNRLALNGMSYYNRDKENANSALVVTVGVEDFQKECYNFNNKIFNEKYPLLGMEMQRYYEEQAFMAGGSDFNAPVQLVGDFLRDESSKKIGSVNPSYKPGYKPTNLKNCLPDYVVDTLKEGILSFDKKIKGFSDNDAILTGIETRTSAPVKIMRNENLESISINGLFPCGEGAGFAGGIMSAAVDGLKCAEAIIKKYKPLD